jgi:TRAP-type C4-dicarboxylate transport system permease small subunit
MSSNVFDVTERALYAAAAFALLAIVVVMIGRVFSRNFSLGWAGLQEIAQLLAVWLTFLVAGSLARERDHIEIDYFTEKFPEWIKPYHEIGVSVLNLWIAGVLLVGSFRALVDFADSTSPSLGLPIPLYYAAPLVGVTFLVVVWTRRLYLDVRTVLPESIQSSLSGGGDADDE